MTKIASVNNLTFSDEVLKLNPQLTAKPAQPKTEAKKDLDKEIRQAFARQFETIWKRCNGPELVKEFKLSSVAHEVEYCEIKDWRNDYLHEATKIIIELDGGIYSGGRHVRAKGFIEDCVKLNAATMHGYKIIRIPTGFATDDYIGKVIKFIKNAQEGQQSDNL